MKMLLMKLLSFDKTNWFINIFNIICLSEVCAMYVGVVNRLIMLMGNEETVENEETSEDDKADDNEV